MDTMLPFLASALGALFIILGLRSFTHWQRERIMPLEGVFNHFSAFMVQRYEFMHGRPFAGLLSAQQMKSFYLFKLLAFKCFGRITLGMYLVLTEAPVLLD